jgi:hypothetical protein
MIFVPAMLEKQIGRRGVASHQAMRARIIPLRQKGHRDFQPSRRRSNKGAAIIDPVLDYDPAAGRIADAG